MTVPVADHGVTRAEFCVVACADAWRGAGEVMASPFGTIPSLGRIRMFNAGSKVSTGPISTGLNGMPFGLPRLIQHMSRDFLRDQAYGLLEEFETYEEPDAWEAVRTGGEEVP